MQQEIPFSDLVIGERYKYEWNHRILTGELKRKVGNGINAWMAYFVLNIADDDLPIYSVLNASRGPYYANVVSPFNNAYGRESKKRKSKKRKSKKRKPKKRKTIRK